MPIRSKKITVLDEKGQSIKVKGWFKVSKSTYIDELPSENEYLTAIEIDGRIIDKSDYIDETIFFDEKTNTTYKF